MKRCKITLGLLCLALTLLVVIPAQAFPPSGYDNISTTASINIYDPVDSSLLLETITMIGDAVIWRGNEYDPGDGRIIVPTRLDTLLLSGYSLTYGDSIFATLNRSMPVATGQIQQVTAGQDFPAESFFDVYYKITIGPPAPNPPSPAGDAQGKLQYDIQSGIGKAMLASGRLSTSDRGVAKAPYTGPANKEDAAARQGGDNIASPTVISALPYNDVGVTTGYTNDYDEACPSVSTSPDVVYSFTPSADTFIIIDLCGPETDYDTKVFVYENNVNTLVACNDDACSNAQTQYISKVECFAVTAGSRYYIVIDGWGGAFGMYQLQVDYCSGLPCVVDCPAGASFEDEPCGQDFNGGCNAAPPVFTPIQCGETICGTAWADTNTRDTDWYELVLSQSMTVNFTVVCEFPGLIGLVEMGTPGSGDCADQTGALNPYSFGNACDTLSISIGLGPGTHWLFVAPSVYDGYPCATGPWDYVATVTCTPQIIWVNPDSVHMLDTIYQIPPLGRVYKDPRKTPVIDQATGDTVSWLWHEHRVDPPPGGNDTIPTTGWMDVVQGSNQPGPTQPPDETIRVDGQAIIQRGDPSVSPSSGKWVIPTEILKMDLTGESVLFGPVILSLPQPAPGQTTSLTPNEFWPVESFFDVMYQVEFPQIGQIIAPMDIIPHMVTEGPSEKIPPEDLSLVDTNWHPVHDVQNPGVIIGWVRPIHWLPPRQDSTGACCDLSNGNCRITTAADCNPVHEVYQGNGTTCTPNPCQVPPPANDCFESVGQGTITLDVGDNQCAGGIQLSLTSAFSPDTRIETDPPPYHDGQTIQTEMVQMELTTVDPTLGTVIIRERADQASTGQIQNTVTDGQGNFQSGDSFFDIFLEVELPDLGLLLNTGSSTLRMEATIYNLPPDSAYFPPPDQAPLPLYDTATGQQVGWLCHAQHVPGIPIPCDEPRGACCDTAVGTCRIVDQFNCTGSTDVWQGPNTSCVPSPCVDTCSGQYPGDLNSDGVINQGDFVYLVKYVGCSGPPPSVLANADVNGDCVVDQADVDYLQAFLFSNGPPPVDCTCVNPTPPQCNPCSGWTPGIDTIQFSTFDIDVYDPNDTSVLLGTMIAYGVDMIVQRDALFEASPGIWRMNTTVLQFSGSGNSALFGTFYIDLDPNYVSGGYIQQCDSCSDSTAESFFDIIWRITTSLPFPLDTLRGDTAKMHLPCSAGWNPGDPFTPPDGHSYNDPRRVPIYDAAGQIIGYTVKRHAVNNEPPCTHWTPGVDTILFSTFSIDVYNPADSTDYWGTMVAYGTQMIVQRGAPYEVSPNIWRMDTDILQLTGAGNSALFGPFTIGLDPDQTSGGFIEQCDSCNDNWARSEFTVNYVITTTLPPPESQLTGSSLMELPCAAQWNPGDPFTPPDGHSYNDPRKVPIYDAAGQLIGYSIKRHAVSSEPPCTHWTPGLDTIFFSTFEIEYYDPSDTVTPADTLVAYGVNMVVERLAPFEDSPNIWRMNTKVLEFSGSGVSPILGAFQIGLDPNATSGGFIRQCDSCNDNWAESFFDIIYVITTSLPPPMDTVQADTAKMHLPCSEGWNPGDPFTPPNGGSYVDPRKVPIYDAAGNIIGYIWKRHHVADTPNSDIGACCVGDACGLATQAACDEIQGVFQGLGTTCLPNNPCAQQECCNHDGIRGDVDYNFSLDVGDLTYLVDYLFRGGPPPPCFEEADANGSGGIDVSDLTLLVDYLFGGGLPPLPCLLK